MAIRKEKLVRVDIRRQPDSRQRDRRHVDDAELIIILGSSVIVPDRPQRDRVFQSTVIIENRWEEILERSYVVANAVVPRFSPCGATCPGSSPTTCLQGSCSGPFATDLWTTSWNKWKKLNSYYTVLNINQLICIGVTKPYNIRQLIICIGITKVFSSAGVCNAYPTLTIQIKSYIVMTDYCILCHPGKWQLGVGHLPNELR